MAVGVMSGEEMTVDEMACCQKLGTLLFLPRLVREPGIYMYNFSHFTADLQQLPKNIA
jgi:hypothetical protein